MLLNVEYIACILPVSFQRFARGPVLYHLKDYDFRKELCVHDACLENKQDLWVLNIQN